MESLKAIASTGDIGQKYLRGEKLGQGTFGCVYGGTTHDGKKQVAIKVIASACQRHQLILQEVKHLKSSPHPNIVQFVDCYLQKTSFCIVMEYIHGITARDCIGYATPRHIATVCGSVLQALNCLHWKCIIHRDVKEMNIMISGQTGIVKLIDLGTSADERHNLRMNVGSSYYSAPELVTTTDYTCKVDIWALGITMFELTGNNPYPGCRNVTDIINRIKQMRPPQIPQGLPELMRKFMQQCLLIDTWDRPAAYVLSGHAFVKQRASAKEMSMLAKNIMRARKK